MFLSLEKADEVSSISMARLKTRLEFQHQMLNELLLCHAPLPVLDFSVLLRTGNQKLLKQLVLLCHCLKGHVLTSVSLL